MECRLPEDLEYGWVSPFAHGLGVFVVLAVYIRPSMYKLHSQGGGIGS